MKKTAGPIIALLILIFFGVIAFNLNNTSQPKVKGAATQKTIQKITVQEKITDNTGTTKTIEKQTIDAGTTALQLLQNTTAVKIEGEGKNAFVVEINGRIADKSKREFWAFYVNSKQAELGAGSYIIKDNDSIEWKIENY